VNDLSIAANPIVVPDTKPHTSELSQFCQEMQALPFLVALLQNEVKNLVNENKALKEQIERMEREEGSNGRTEMIPNAPE
jgi:hypothetical protein